jgi:hypothetical protein
MLTVTGEMPAVEDPAGVTDVGLVDMDFTVPDTFAAGPQIWRVQNNGLQIHHLVLLGVPEGATEDDVMELAAMFAAGPPASPEAGASPVAMPALNPDEVTDEYFTPLFSRGQFNLVEVDLAPGTYAMVCFMPDPSGTPHVMLGMVEIIVVVLASRHPIAIRRRPARIAGASACPACRYALITTPLPDLPNGGDRQYGEEHRHEHVRAQRESDGRHPQAEHALIDHDPAVGPEQLGNNQARKDGRSHQGSDNGDPRRHVTPTDQDRTRRLGGRIRDSDRNDHHPERCHDALVRPDRPTNAARQLASTGIPGAVNGRRAPASRAAKAAAVTAGLPPERSSPTSRARNRTGKTISRPS